jgi:hypothetical protein
MVSGDILSVVARYAVEGRDNFEFAWVFFEQPLQLLRCFLGLKRAHAVDEFSSSPKALDGFS